MYNFFNRLRIPRACMVSFYIFYRRNWKSYADAPKGQEISAPHAANAECGVSGMWGYKNDADRGVLKER
ncbi:hypothetical protein Barb6_00001 [Bacteroidales bacterium Barb6]|nr:hypothetical protein Barb6XT_00709 [Bacteroidales bacterium Barb6XT]OAV73674.1 hypothetical protein Barb6_00001 [Bacteroidales bacterium Barb6]